MDCPKCETQNPAIRKFCYECGAKLSRPCPECGVENLPRDKFCGECGQDLRAPPRGVSDSPPLEEKIRKIQRYLPKGLTEKILSQRDKIEGERRQVTVMFCDMEGFTQLADRMGPEETYSIMDQVYEILIHKVHDYGGTVNEMTGDGIMALFGAPIAVEDAAQRAVRSAYAIHKEIARFTDQIGEKGLQPPRVRMRIGIHSGPVVVGTLGNDLRVEFKAVGDTVNLASRVEGLAEPGATLVSEETYHQTRGFFRFEALGSRPVKGKDKPISVYRVIAPNTRRTRFEANAERGLTPLFGRDRELGLLLDAYERARVGKGQAFSIVSPAGMGKSRLLYEFRKEVANENTTFLEGKCLSYSMGQAYHPIIDMLRGSFDIQEEDKEEKIKEKVREGLRQIAVEEETCLPYLLDLLSAHNGHVDSKSMNPEMRKAKIIEAFNRIVISSSLVRPLILAFEDLHWMDVSSEDVIRYVLSSIAGSRVLLLFTYRPEYVHKWENKSYHSQLNLSRLSNTECLAISRHLLGSTELEDKLEELVLERTEGVPFFVEEFIRSMDELGFVQRKGSACHLAANARDLMVPSSIQDIIMARIDPLPVETKEVLQIGSAIEREFSFEMIRKTTGLPEKRLLSHLSVLRDAELIYERGIYPHSCFIFQHSLVQDVVYNTQLTQSRRGFHERIAQALEEIHRERLEEHYETIAGHYEKSGNPKQALRYLMLAGEKSNKHNAVQAAYGFFQRAYDTVRTGTASLDHKGMVKLHLGLARSSLNLGDIDTAAHHYRKEIELSGSYGSTEDERKARLGLTAMMYMWPVRSEAETTLEEALEWARRNQDTHLESVALSTKGHLTAVYGLPGKGYELTCKGERIALEANNPVALSSARMVRSLMERWLGRPSIAVELTEGMFEALRGIYALTFLPIVAQARGLALAEMGRVQEAISLTKEGIEICEKFGASFRLGALYNCLGYCYAEILQPVRAWKMNLRSEEVARQQMLDSPMGRSGYAEILAMATANLMENLFEQGKPEETWERIKLFRIESEGNEFDVFRYRWESRMQYLEAQMLKQKGDLDSAEKAIQSGIRLSKEKQMSKRHGGFLRLLGEVKAARNETESGLADLQEALSISETVANPRHLWQTHASIAICYQQLKRPEREGLHWRAAAFAIENLAQSLTDPQDRSQFLAAPSIRRILSHVRP